jgi:hypothetical protein
MKIVNTHHTLEDCLRLICKGHTRCRTCARIYTAGSNHLPGYCPSHSKFEYNEMVVLGRISGVIQDWFYEASIIRFLHLHGKPESQREGLTPGELWTWMRVNAFSMQCEVSLVDVVPFWQKYLADGYIGRK